MRYYSIVDYGALVRAAAELHGHRLTPEAVDAVFPGQHRTVVLSAKNPPFAALRAAFEGMGWTVAPFDPMPAEGGRVRAYPEVVMAIEVATEILVHGADQIVLGTGAGAAYPIAAFARQHGRRVVARCYAQQLSGELRRHCDRVDLLDLP